MKKYSFPITIEGTGDSPEKAWQDATLNLALHGAEMPEYQEIEDADD